MAASTAQDAPGAGSGDMAEAMAVPVELALGGKSGGRGGKPAASKRKPRATKDAPAAKPSRTLDMWFKPTGAKAGVQDARKEGKAPEKAASSGAEQSPPRPKASAAASKKMVQRRIHITDVCRICDSARTEDASRCELRCVGCDVTVHKKCYNVKDDPPDRTWHCRRCAFALEQQSPSKSSEDAEDSGGDGSSPAPEDAVPDLANTTFPSLDALPDAHAYAALHRDANFASVFRFLQRFRHLGLRVPADLSLHTLANAVLNPHESRLCEDLHAKLLATVNTSTNKNYSWSGNVLRFLDSADLDTATLADCPGLAARDKAEDDRRDDAAYWSLPVRERVAILKFLCELQFDRNDKLVARIDGEDADAMRDEPIGADANGRAYYVLEDIGTIPNAAAWVCRCAAADGSAWETVSDDLASLEALVRALSLSPETRELQLWQSLSGGVLKKLTRRRAKDQRARARLERMPRMLGAAGLDAASILPAGGGRALRSRRQVNYRQLLDADEEEEEEEEEEQEEQEEKQQSRPRRSKRAGGSEASDSAASEEDDDDEEEEADESLGGTDDDDDSPHAPTRRSARKRAPASPPARRSKRLRASPSSSP